MKVKTVIEKRIPYSIPKKKRINKLFFAVILVFDLFMNTLLPFIFGFYFAKTRNLIFISLLLIALFIKVNFQIDKKGDIDIKFIRGI